MQLKILLLLVISLTLGFADNLLAAESSINTHELARSMENDYHSPIEILSVTPDIGANIMAYVAGQSHQKFYDIKFVTYFRQYRFRGTCPATIDYNQATLFVMNCSYRAEQEIPANVRVRLPMGFWVDETEGYDVISDN